MTLENLSADIAYRVSIAASAGESAINQANLVANLLRENLPAVHPNLKQCCGCKAIWTADKFEPHNICPNCGGQCGGLRVML